MSKQTIATGEKKKFRCFYINNDDKPVSRVLELEKLSHPILTEAGVNAWIQRGIDSYNTNYAYIYIQLTDEICYRNGSSYCNSRLLEFFDGNLDGWNDDRIEEYHKGTAQAFTRLASMPEAQLNGTCYPNMAVIEAYRAAGEEETAQILAKHRNAIIAEREEEDKRRRAEEAERERLAKEKAARELAQQIADEEESLRTKGVISGWGVVQLCDREGIKIHLRTRHNLLEVVTTFEKSSVNYIKQGKRLPSLDGCFKTFHELKAKLGIE